MKPALIITALMAEAAPLIARWRLKPIRNAPALERFQTFGGNGRFVAISGIGKVRSAVATATVATALTNGEEPLIVNLGLAGSTRVQSNKGDLFVINKVRDVATNTRFYPDILIRHELNESGLDTHDHPVKIPSEEPVLVDMEGAGFMQAATSVVPPSCVAVLKVVSDLCDGERITKEDAENLIESRLSCIERVIDNWQNKLTPPLRFSSEELNLIERLIEEKRLSQSQRIQIERLLLSLKAIKVSCSDVIISFSSQPVHSKSDQRALFNEMISTMQNAIQL